MINLSILEIGEVFNSTEQVIEDTLELVKLADLLGYKRFWLGEHHENGIAWRSPDVLIAILAGYTDSIRIGSGGVLLPLSSPLRIAQNYRLLSTIFPNRIDLGLARGTTSDHIAKALLGGMDLNSNLKSHSLRIKETIEYLTNNSKTIDGKAITMAPSNSQTPEIWVLGSSGNTLQTAFEMNVNYSFSLLHSFCKIKEIGNRKLFKEYINAFQNANDYKSKTSLTIGIVCAKKKRVYEEIQNNHKGNVVINIAGEKERCFDEINKLTEEFKTNEVMIYFIGNDYANKVYCYESFSEMFNTEKRKL